MHMHVESSSSLIVRLSPRLNCPELEIYTVRVCDWIESQNHIGKFEHLKDGIRHRLIQRPFYIERSVRSRDGLLRYWICLGYDELWVLYHVPGTNGEFPVPARIGRGNVFLLVCWYTRPLLIVSGNHGTRVAYILYGFLQCKTNAHYFQNIDMDLGLVFRLANMKGHSHRFAPHP